MENQRCLNLLKYSYYMYIALFYFYFSIQLFQLYKSFFIVFPNQFKDFRDIKMTEQFGSKTMNLLYTGAPLIKTGSLQSTGNKLDKPRSSIKFLHTSLPTQQVTFLQPLIPPLSPSNAPTNSGQSNWMAPLQSKQPQQQPQQNVILSSSIQLKPYEQKERYQIERQARTAQSHNMTKDLRSDLYNSGTQIVNPHFNSSNENFTSEKLTSFQKDNPENQKRIEKQIIPQQNLNYEKKKFVDQTSRLSLNYLKIGNQKFEEEKEKEKQKEKEKEKEKTEASLKKNSSSTNESYLSFTSQEASDYFKQNIRELLRKVNKLSENKREARSIWLDVDFGHTPCLSQNRIHNLKKKVFTIFEDILSVSFHLHFKQGMAYEKVKAYCCQNFIINLCRLSNLQKLDAKELQILQQHLQEEVLPYLNLSYPRSDQKIMNKQLKRKVGQKDIFNENRFDIVYNSRVKLSTKKTDINSQVMKILNYMIKLPDEKVYGTASNSSQIRESGARLTRHQSLKDQQVKERTLYQNFQRDFQTILSKIFKKSMTDTLFKLGQKQQNRVIQQLNKNYWNSGQLMRDLDEKIIAKIQSDIGQDSEKQKDEEQEYKEKVQTYTKFKIGRKIPAHVEPYTKQQIEEGALIMKDSSVARVLMKWAEAVEEQIQDPAKSLYLRDQPFRLHGDAGEQTYELSTEKSIKQLYGYFIRSSKVVKEKSEILKNNAREIFLEAIKSAEQVEKFRSYREFSSQNDALVGHVCTVLLKSRENHISSYLNMLLGQIKYIEQEYQWQIEDKRINITSRPSLINMRLGDLMRCQITSKPKEIVSVYQYISLLCKICPNIFQMVRVKNRSDTPNKDILINIFYHKKIMIEIQLAIKNESAFISCSDSFSHFIYEMERSFLGPVNEICSIWSLYSPKSEFFIKKFNKLNIQRPENNKIQTNRAFDPNQCKHIYEDQERQLKLPFTCSSCTVFYYNSSVPRKCCIKCSAFQCSICNIKSDVDAWIGRQYPSFEVKKDRQVGKLFYALDIQTNYRQIKEMIEVQINGKLEAYSMKISVPIDELVQQNKFLSQDVPEAKFETNTKDLWQIQQISKIKNLQRIKVDNIKSEYEIKKLERTNLKRELFAQTHIILQKKMNNKVMKIKGMYPIQKSAEKIREEQVVNEIIKQILKQHYLPKRTNVIFKKSQSFMKLTLITNPTVLPEVKGEIIKNIIDSRKEILRRIQKLNLNQNGLTQIQLSDKMPNAKNVILNMNSLSTLDLKGFNNLISLELANNRITSLQNLLNLNKCVNLTRLLLNHNQITDLIGLPEQLINLQVLGLSNNKIQSVENMPYLRSIKSLDFSSNHLKKLRGIQKLKSLEQLKINNNKELTESINGVDLLKQLRKLKRLDLSQTSLCQSSFQIKKVFKYSMDSVNTKTDLPHIEEQYEPLLAVESLTELENLNASSNSLYSVPKIMDLQKLTQLDLSHNALSNTENIKHFKMLKWLCLKDNTLVNIDKLDELTGLYWLDLSQNKLNSSQLRVISKLKNLHEIELSDNELTNLADLGSLPKLYELNIRNNKIKTLQGLEKLSALEHLDARFNEQLSSLTGIENLNMLFELKLSWSFIRDMRALKNTQRLRILELNNCGITAITDIPILKNLQELYLNCNRLINTTGISNFHSLKKLEIKDNKNIRVNQNDFNELTNLNNILFTLTPSIELKFISQVTSLQIIRIDNIDNKTAQQHTILISLSLLNYNIQSAEMEQNPKQARNSPLIKKLQDKHGKFNLRVNQSAFQETLEHSDDNFDYSYSLRQEKFVGSVNRSFRN